QEKLKGTWKAVTIERGGQSKEDTKDHCLAFADGEFTLKRDGELFAKGKYTLDPAKDPKEIDMEITEDRGDGDNNKGKKVLGIYTVTGDELRWCLAPPGEADRPKEFATQAGTKHMLITLKRQKAD